MLKLSVRLTKALQRLTFGSLKTLGLLNVARVEDNLTARDCVTAAEQPPNLVNLVAMMMLRIELSAKPLQEMKR